MMTRYRQRAPLPLAMLVALATGLSTMPAQAVDDGLLEARRGFFTGIGGAVRFRNIEDLFPVVEVAAADRTAPLPYGDLDSLDDLRYEYDGESLDLQTFLVGNRSNALLVIKDGAIVTEIYRNGATAEDRFMSFSTGKSITSTLVGIARDEGLIASLDDPLTNYIPKLRGSAYDGVTIRQALQMSTGTDFSEDYEPPEDAGDEWVSPFQAAIDTTLFRQEARFSDYATTFARKDPPGTVFNYNTFDTGLLGTLVANASGMPFEQYLEKKLWQPAGMEADAALVLDGPPGTGEPLAGGGYLMRLRDYGRFGLLALNAGRANGRQVVSAEWLREATAPDPDRPDLHPPKLEDGNGYQHQWWLFEQGDYSAEGVFGQFVYVNPAERLVIVKLSYWVEAWTEEEALSAKAFFRAVADHLR